jgi:hypothetical protein
MTQSNSGTQLDGHGRRRSNPRGQGARLREELIDAACALLTETGDAGQLSTLAPTLSPAASPTPASLWLILVSTA